MWGIWAIVLGGVLIGGLFLLVGLFLFASPVIAVLIAIAAAAAAASVVFVGRRGEARVQEGSGSPGSGSRTQRSARPQNPRSGGAPASGEGGAPSVESGTPQL